MGELFLYSLKVLLCSGNFSAIFSAKAFCSSLSLSIASNICCLRFLPPFHHAGALTAWGDRHFILCILTFAFRHGQIILPLVNYSCGASCLCTPRPAAFDVVHSLAGDIRSVIRPDSAFYLLLSSQSKVVSFSCI